MGGAGERHHAGGALCLGQLVLDDLAHRHQRLILYALGHIDDQLAVWDVLGRLFGGGTHKRGRHGEQQDIAARAGLGDIGGVVHGVGQLHTRQVGVAAGGAERFQLGRDGAPNGHIAAVDRQQAGQRNAPGACAEYGNFNHGWFSLQI